jgi:peptidoglycan/LPS O-acetylase OafA/YrhL
MSKYRSQPRAATAKHTALPATRIQREHNGGQMTSALRDRPQMLAGAVATHSKTRADLQGLRALAVVAVILDHLIGWPLGGFVGVDVFFVLSGFLITGLLLREHDRTGTISFSGFYRRRIKRILPAAILVLATTVIASFLAFNVPRAMETLGDGIAGFFFVANWRTALIGTDYFQSGGPVSPLQHYWSLAVEEQFYVIWPLLMVLIFVAASRWRLSVKRTHLVVAVAMLILCTFSFLWALSETKTAPTWAYFSTFSRAWELGVGAIAAVFVSSFRHIPSWARPILGWVGLCGIIVSLFTIRPDASFPAPGAALPVLATVLVVIAGTGGEQRFLWPLMNPVTSYVGDISFSLYLWHFPIIILGTAVWGDDPLTLLAIAGATLLAAVYSFHLVEDPIRKSDWLSDGWRTPQRARRRKRSRRRPQKLSRNYQLVALSLVLVVTGGLLAAVFQPSPVVTQAAQMALPVETPAPDAPAVPPLLAALQAEISVGLRAASYPDALLPTMDQAIASVQAPPEVAACGNTGKLVNRESCTWGSEAAPNHAVIVGDSVSMTYVGALSKVLPADWKLTSMGTFACSFTNFDQVGPIGAGCVDRKADAVDEINASQPEVVFIANSYWQGPLPGAENSPTADEWEANLESLLPKIAQSVGKIVFLAAPPSELNPKSCYTPVSSPADCSSAITSTWSNQAAAEKKLAESVGGEWIDSSEWFCLHSNCPIFVGSTPVRSDLTHMTVEYAQRIAPVIGEALELRGIWQPRT